MAGIVVSIDGGASGLVRHRFARALSAGLLWLLALAICHFLWLTFSLLFLDIGGWLLAIVIAVPIFVVVFSVAVAVIAGVLGLMHRRLAALASFILFSFALVFAGVFAVGGVQGALNAALPESFFSPWQSALLAAGGALALAIALEGAVWSLWQLVVDKDQFLAVRGWRPPPWRIFSVTRRVMGMPAFIANFGRGRVSLTIMYALIALLNLGLVAVLVIPLLAGTLLLPGFDNNTTIAFIAAFAALPILNALGLGQVLGAWAARRSTKLYQEVREWDARPPIVFLRAFDQDREKLLVHARDPLVKFPAGCGEARTLDEILLENASIYGPVIAIGDPRNPAPPLGAARVFVPGENNEWRHVVESLLRGANAVVVCPSNSEGVRWELELISDATERLRVLFLANPVLSKEETLALFQQLAPPGEVPELVPGELPVAAYLSGRGQWRVLTSRSPPSVQTYTVALNYSLQDLLGFEGAKLVRPSRRRGRVQRPS